MWRASAWYSVCMYRCFLTLALVLLLPIFANAQSSQSLTLIAEPSYPEASEAYTLKLQTTSLESRNDITWFIDGSEASNFRNSNILTIGKGESPKQVKVRVTQNDGSILEKTYVANPYRVDLIVHAETQTPPFYKGASLPSSGTDVTVHALVFNNNVAVSSNYSYLWRVDGKVQNGGPIFAKNSMTFSPNFQTNVSISVDVLNREGTIVTSESTSLPIAEPEIQFYEVNPLRGVSQIALRDPHIFVGDELHIRAESYFMGDAPASDIFSEWKLNGTGVQSTPKSKQEIVLQKQGAGGTSELFFHIRNLKQVLQGVEDSLTLRF